MRYIPLNLLGAWIDLLFLVAGILQTGRVLPVEEMAARATVIGLATVEHAFCRTDPRNNMIYTDHRLRFDEVWKGEPRSPFVLMKAGGTIGERSTAVAGEEYALKPGEQILVFATPSSLGNHVVMGLRQGLYRKKGAGVDAPYFRESESGRGIPRPLPELREAVYRSLGKDLPSESAAPSKPSTPPAAEIPRSPQDSASRERSSDVPSRNPWPAVAGLLAILAAGLLVLARRAAKKESP